MATFFGSILGNIGGLGTIANSSGLNSQHLHNAQLSALHNYGGNMGALSNRPPQMFQIDEDMYKLQRYAELCGDTIEVVDLPVGKETDDVKIALLKAAEVGKVVKNVGMKLSDTRFAVYREEGEVYV